MPDNNSKGMKIIRPIKGETKFASSVSPHYKFSDLNAPILNLPEGSTPVPPSEKDKDLMQNH